MLVNTPILEAYNVLLFGFKLHVVQIEMTSHLDWNNKSFFCMVKLQLFEDIEIIYILKIGDNLLQ